MIMFHCFILVSFIVHSVTGVNENGSSTNNIGTSDGVAVQPLVYVVLTARNEELTLPYFLTYFELLSYPTSRMILHIRADHCDDRTVDILDEWLDQNGHRYLRVDAVLNKAREGFRVKCNVSNNIEENGSRLVKLKTEAFYSAQKSDADYVLFLDTDVFLLNTNVIGDLIGFDHTIVSPMLQSTRDYSNFWGAMSEEFYYESSELFYSIFDRKVSGCFSVPLVRSFVLIDLHNPSVRRISFDANSITELEIPYDDYITFAVSSALAGITTHICNDKEYGLVVHPRAPAGPSDIYKKLIRDLKVRSARSRVLLGANAKFVKYLPPPVLKDKAGLDQVYYLNLDKRKDRREQMEYILDTVGIAAQRVQAVDGNDLTEEVKNELGVKEIEGFLDPNLHRPVSRGEMGGTITHYNIWNNIIDNKYEKAMVFEDDVQFFPNFKENLRSLLAHLANARIEWDFIFLGYKDLEAELPKLEVPGAPMLEVSKYSYWLVGYLISQSGALKLVNADPLSKILACDEFLPIMYDRSPLAEHLATIVFSPHSGKMDQFLSSSTQ
ncbi:glycosyltransferase 25 family member isoform X2 [Hyalella azteca]|uniref:Glycosyltransferase 25 family member isoform X2 n=1 Tax=Hyalella azteca TaxID=294128 RepID=A0A8B7PQ80_HYAAZ|nr:glycosyltransferase 25 family member isoform X2 [Hyalella azteca]